ncbi:hypothetical protein [Saccharopolyspora sp. 5N708]|uniref:hypothetical protein n=1 Tax=Saccharopolyspora sp. 5N708 TaxID=3457424 RepID=UPI003FD5DEC7
MVHLSDSLDAVIDDTHQGVVMVFDAETGTPRKILDAGSLAAPDAATLATSWNWPTSRPECMSTPSASVSPRPANSPPT